VQLEEVRPITIEVNVNPQYPLCSDTAYASVGPPYDPGELLGVTIIMVVPAYRVHRSSIILEAEQSLNPTALLAG